ncbi:MAG: response regulator [Chromatiaceae bacterium]|nr:response regulator [Chromatiaceae bacterium]
MSIEIRNRKSLLIVDDDTSLRQMLCWTFDDMGYFTWGVGDSASAIDAVKGLSFAFALVDYHLPDGDGLTLMQMLERHSPRLHAALMSADPAAIDMTRPGRVPVAFFEKPVPILEIDRMFMQAIPV